MKFRFCICLVGWYCLPACSATGDLPLKQGSSWELVQHSQITGVGSAEFGLVTHVAASAHYVAVADAYDRSIHVFGLNGESLVSAGRQGRGPGEFVSITSVYPYGPDSVVVHDNMAQRLTIVPVSGGSLRSLPLTYGYGVALHGTISDSLFVITVGRALQTRRDPIGFYWDSSTAIILQRNGRTADTVARLPDRLNHGGPNVPPVFLAPYAHVAANADRYCFTDSLQPIVDCFDSVGSTVSRATWDQLRQAVTNEVQTQYLTLYTERAPRSVDPRWLSERLEDVVWTDTLPATGALLVSASGEAWVKQYQLLTEPGPSLWRVSDPSGRMLGTIEVPAEFEPLSIADDLMWGIWRDSLDVTSVKAFTVRR